MIHYVQGRFEMKKVAVIPLRAGSKGIPMKNRKRILGRPLFTWVLCEAIFSNLDEIYVYTDDQWISDFITQEYTWSSKVKILERPVSTATDTASTELAMQEFVKQIDHNYDMLCLLQATSPLTKRYDINQCLSLVESGEYDSTLSVVETKRFIWSQRGESLNYDYTHRPRRQDFDGMFVENGAVYTTTKKQFEESGIRIGGKIGIVPMREETLTEIDEPVDFTIIENLIQTELQHMKGSGLKVKTLFLDVDGIFTPAQVAYSQDGEFSKTFNMQDGMGLQLIREAGVEVVVITSEKSHIVKERMDKLGIKHLYMGVKDKFSRMEAILSELDCTRSEVAYMGDDINDLSCLASVGWGITPQNGVSEVKSVVDMITSAQGGHGAIREAVEFIMKWNRRYV